MEKESKELTLRECLEAMVGHAKRGRVPGQHMMSECEQVLNRAEDVRRRKLAKVAA